MKHPAKLRLRLRGAAALLALLALAAGAVFALRGRAQAAEWAFEPEPGQVFAAFGNSFAACSSTQLQIYGPEGELCLRAELPQHADTAHTAVKNAHRAFPRSSLPGFHTVLQFLLCVT